MTLQQVFDFLAVAQHGSLHAAARASGQTQPALTKSLKRLEADLGSPLFERHAKGMQPTVFGRRFLEHAKRLAAEARRAKESIEQMRGERLGRVEYGISVAPSLLLAPSAIKRFRLRYPEVELRSRSGLYHSLAPLLRDGQLDFAISPLPGDPVDPQLEVSVLLRSEMVLVARRGHPQAGARGLRELEGARFVVGGPRGQPGAGIYRLFEQAGLEAPRVELQTDGLIDTLALLVASDCLALLPAVLLRSGLLKERLTTVPVVEPMPVYQVGLFSPGAVPLTPAAKELVTQFDREAAYLGARQTPAPKASGRAGK
jgi:DNA-binding transcriptional LysR family regulator